MDELLRHAGGGRDLWGKTAPGSGANIYDLVFHPEGLAPWMTNEAEVLCETLRRLRIEVARGMAPQAVLARMEGFAEKRGLACAARSPPPLLLERYALGGTRIAVISVLSHLASPGEAELERVRFETFVPADGATEAFFRTL